MQFRVGAYTYTVRRKWNLTLGGERVDGYCASTVRSILLDGDLSDEVLLSTLRHEHTHAWANEVGTPGTAEDQANFTACVGDAFDAEFSEQGGMEALRAIPIEGLRGSDRGNRASDQRITDRVECGRCGAAIMSGSICSDEPRIAGAMTLVPRGCQCPVCDAVQTWDERATPAGVPLGEYFNVRLLDGAEASQWLAEHRVHCPYNLS